MEVKLNDEQLNAIITKAVMDSLTPDKREALIQGAVKALLDRQTGTGYGAKSHFQRAFDDAVAAVAHKVAEEYIRSDPAVQAKLSQLFQDAWAQLTTDAAYEGLVEKVANAMSKGLTGDRY